MLVTDYWLLGKPENCPPGRAGRTGLLSIRYWIFFYCWLLLVAGYWILFTVYWKNLKIGY